MFENIQTAAYNCARTLGQNLTKSAMVAAQKVFLACLWRLLNNSGLNRQRYILEAQWGKKYSKIGIKFLSVIYFINLLSEGSS